MKMKTAIRIKFRRKIKIDTPAPQLIIIFENI